MKKRELYFKLWWLEAFKDWWYLWFTDWDGCEPGPNLEHKTYEDFKKFINYRAKDKDFSSEKRRK